MLRLQHPEKDYRIPEVGAELFPLPSGGEGQGEGTPLCYGRHVADH